MNIQPLGGDLKREYGILCQRLGLASGGEAAPFGSAWCVIEPAGRTNPHRHPEAETFLILEGRGAMTIDGERSPVKAGDAVSIPSESLHALENESSETALRFLSLWWEPRAARVRRTLVVTPPPTPNGDLHLGHLSGPYIAGDARRRYLKMRGVEATYLCGSDDHQSYVASKAEQSGLSPEAVAGRYARSIERTLADAGVTVERFVKPQDEPAYKAFVQDAFRRMASEGKLIKKRVDSLYCEPCGRHLYEAWAGGSCPNCGAGTNAHGCEQCAFVNDGVDLVEPRCNGCRRPASTRPVVKFYLPLGRYAEDIRRFHGSVAMSRRLREMTEAMLEKGLPDLCVSHVSDWGIPVPVPGFEGQVIYAWFEMAMGYARIASPDVDVEQFFGFDNAYFYSMAIPAMLLAYDPRVRLPSALVLNEFLNLDGSKFSTSRRHAIWADEMIPVVGADVVRFALACVRPEAEQTNFTLEEFGALVDDELAGRWESWLSSLDRDVDVRWGRVVPEGAAEIPEASEVRERLRALVAEAEEAYDGKTFSSVAATRVVRALVREGRELSRRREGLSAERSVRDAALLLELTALRALATVAAPLMPEWSDRTLAALGPAPGAILWESAVTAPAPGAKLKPVATREFCRSARALREFRNSRAMPALAQAGAL
ncbi:MAG: class I tRNA ligase family protein [Proteobacteria bacterium]|nr:class I tRNA ligase family protein [Pseudomonadota bacterium]